jgi:hypothetical protein
MATTQSNAGIVQQEVRMEAQRQWRDPLIGQYYISRDESGAVVKAGRIRDKSGDMFLLTVYEANGSRRGEIVEPATMTGWELYIDELNWRRAYSR